MRSARLAVPSTLLALALVGGCGGATSTATAPTGGASAPVASAPTATAPSDPGTGATPSTAAGDAAPVDATCPTSNTTAFAKTKFVAHAGLAFGAFHRYIYKPYQAGAFASGKSGRVVALAKAGAAALFVKREIRLATEDVKANPTLCKAIAAPLAQVGNSIGGAVSQLKGGDTSGLAAAEKAITGIKSKAASSGDPITEDPDAPLS